MCMWPALYAVVCIWGDQFGDRPLNPQHKNFQMAGYTEVTAACSLDADTLCMIATEGVLGFWQA